MVSRRAQSRVQLTPPFPVRRAGLDRSCHRVWSGWGCGIQRRRGADRGRRGLVRRVQDRQDGGRDLVPARHRREARHRDQRAQGGPGRVRRPWPTGHCPCCPSPIEARRAVAQGDAGQRRPHHQGDRVGNRRRHDDMAHRDRNVEVVQQFDFGARWWRSARKTNRRRKQRKRDEDEPCLVVPATPTQGDRRRVGRSQRWQHRPRWRFRLLRSPWTCARTCARWSSTTVGSMTRTSSAERSTVLSGPSRRSGEIR